MLTVAEIREELSHADEERYQALARSLAADERKGVKSALAVARRRLDAEAAEVERVRGMYRYQDELAQGRLLMGLDEVGRGPVAGPLTVGGVVLPPEPQILGVNDSKQLSPQERERLSEQIKATALCWKVVHIAPEEIDAHGMSACLRSAFSRVIAAIDAELPGVGCVLLDGNPLRIDPRERNVVKGDAACASIAAASIVAKVERDNLMRRYALEWPAYAFDENKGYASAQHIEAIKQFGLSPVHRASFCHAWTQETLF